MGHRHAFVLLCGLLLAGCAGSSAPAEEPADAGVTVDAGPPPWLEDGALRHDFEVELGVPKADHTFVPVVDGQDVEISTAGQGLIHLEFDFRATLPPEYAGDSAKLWIDGTTSQPCGGPEVGQYHNKKVLSYHIPPESPEFRPSFNLYLIFREVEPAVYEGNECCVSIHFGAYPPGEKLPDLWTTVERKFKCVNYF